MKRSTFCTLVLATLVAFSTAGYCDEGGWVDRSGNRVPNSDAMKSINGFGGWLVVTPDTDWEEKWNTPQDTIPYFSEASEVRIGEALTILTFFINPKPDAEGTVRIKCDIRIIRPNDTMSIDESGLECVFGQLQGDLRSVRLSSIILKYIGELGDPKGIWRVEVVLTDVNRETIIPLKTSFELTSN